jgi:hypothetical protein
MPQIQSSAGICSVLNSTRHLQILSLVFVDGAQVCTTILQYFKCNPTPLCETGDAKKSLEGQAAVTIMTDRNGKVLMRVSSSQRYLEDAKDM